jgi:hypothetical protein
MHQKIWESWYVFHAYFTVEFVQLNMHVDTKKLLALQGYLSRNQSINNYELTKLKNHPKVVFIPTLSLLWVISFLRIHQPCFQNNISLIGAWAIIYIHTSSSLRPIL